MSVFKALKLKLDWEFEWRDSKILSQISSLLFLEQRNDFRKINSNFKSSFGKIQTVKYNNIPADIELGENVEKMITATRTEVVDMHVSQV